MSWARVVCKQGERPSIERFEILSFDNIQLFEPEFNVKAFLANLKIDELKKFKFQLKTFPEFKEDLQKSSCCEIDEADGVKLADILIKKLPSKRLMLVTLSILDKIKSTELSQASEGLQTLGTDDSVLGEVKTSETEELGLQYQALVLNCMTGLKSHQKVTDYSNNIHAIIATIVPMDILCSVFKMKLVNQQLKIFLLNIKEKKTRHLILLDEMVKDKRCNLQFLRLGSCSASIHQRNDFFLTLHMDQALTCVDFLGSKLPDEGATLLCMTLKYPRCFLKSILKVLLENCQLTETCCKELSFFLMVSQKLTHLSLARNNLGDGGVKILCEGLCYPDCKLHMLVLCGCSISPLYCQALATAIARNLKLETPYLGQSILGKSEVAVTLETLKDNSVPLKTIRLKIDNLSLIMEKLLKKIKESKPSLRVDNATSTTAASYCDLVSEYTATVPLTA